MNGNKNHNNNTGSSDETSQIIKNKSSGICNDSTSGNNGISTDRVVATAIANIITL